jgi:hypothetical protein
MSVVIHNGWFDAIIGQAVRSKKFIFIPVMGNVGNERIDVSYVGETIEYSQFEIVDYIEDFTEIIKLFGADYHEWDLPMYILYWVRGRMTAIFGHGVPLPELNTALEIDYFLVNNIELRDLEVQTNNQLILLDQAFIACKLDDMGIWQSYTFICQDEQSIDPTCGYSPTAALHFFKNDLLNDVYEEIVRDFCSILLQNPDSLYPFSGCHFYHDSLSASICNVFITKEDGFYIEEYGIE